MPAESSKVEKVRWPEVAGVQPPALRCGCRNIGYFKGRTMRRTKGQQSGRKLPVNFSGVVFKYSRHLLVYLCHPPTELTRECGNFVRRTACYASCCRIRETSKVFRWILNSSLFFKQV